MQRRVGVLGGTFDPPHVGHLAAAVGVRSSRSLDEVLLVVAGEPWQKVGTRPLSPALDRLAMVEAAVEGLDGLAASDVEVRRPGPSYTVDTLRELASDDVELHLVLGSDAAAGIESWHEPEALPDLARLVVVGRPGAVAELPAGWPWEVVEVDTPEVSSTDLRRRLATGQPVQGLVPDAVAAVARSRHLYRDGP